nr:interferon gamma receptor 1-like protein [Wadden Sea poxvirus]WGO62763.1 interferon gamma receptor 1-like protein [Wadden Sea poxvirus]
MNNIKTYVFLTLIILCSSKLINISFRSVNFNTIICWKDSDANNSSVYNVLIKNYRSGTWDTIYENVTLGCYNVTSYVLDLDLSLWGKVYNIKNNDEIISKEFIVCKDGKINPPTISISKYNTTKINIRHPVVKIGKKKYRLYNNDDLCGYTFDYYVHINKYVVVLYAGSKYCNHIRCSITIPNKTVCVKAKGVSSDLVFQYPITTVISDTLCV